MKKLTALLTAAVMLLLAISGVFVVTSSDAVVYCDDSGSDSNTGLERNKPKKTLAAAFSLIPSGGTVKIISGVTLSGYTYTSPFVEPSHTGKITVTSDNPSSKAYIKMAAKTSYCLNGPTEFSNLHFNCGTSSTSWQTVIAARFNELTMGEGLSMSTPFIIEGGYETPAASTPTGLDSRITVKSGSYRYIIGFSRTKGEKTLDYTGTSHIDIYGGEINTVYGGSHYNHYAASTEINVYGGSITQLSTAGDVTRRIKKDAYVTVEGGTIQLADMNNIIGNLYFTYRGGVINSMREYYENSELESLALGSRRIMTYDPAAGITEEMILNAGGDFFDVIISNPSVFLKSGADGTGRSEHSPSGDLNVIYGMLSNGGSVTVIGEYHLPSDFTSPVHGGTVVFDGGDDAGIFLDGHDLTLGGDTVFNIKVCGEGTVAADDSDVSFYANNGSAAGPHVRCGGTAVFAAGSYGGVDLTASDDGRGLIIAGGNVGIVTGEGAGETEIIAEGGSAALRLDTFEDSLEIVACGCNLSIQGDDSAKKSGSVFTLYCEPGRTSLTKFSGVKGYFDTAISHRTVFLAGGADGTGRTPLSPAGDLQAAIDSITGEGRIVITGAVELNGQTVTAGSDRVTVTSKCGCLDFRSPDAAVTLKTGFSFKRPVTVEYLDIYQDVSAPVFWFFGHDTVLGEGISITKPVSYEFYPSVVGFRNAGSSGLSYTMTVKSGCYGLFYVTSNSTVNTQTDLDVTANISGGTFTRPLYALNGGASSGNVTLNITGGEFCAGIYGCFNNTSSSFDGDLTYNISGGVFASSIAPAFRKTTTLSGNYYLNITGGSFTRLADLRGPSDFEGDMVQHLYVAGNIDLYREETGDITYSNPVRTAADPWVIFKDGYYYMTKTAGTVLTVSRALNIADLRYAPQVTVFTPPSGQMYSQNLWSPELHYYDASVFGEENAGWYIYLACDNGDNINHRMYVIKSLDGDPLGQYGNPVTGQANIPQKIVSDTDPTVGEVWACGQTDAYINGEYYCCWVSEIYEPNQTNPTHRYQTLNISKMATPWQLTGPCSVICKPTESWEKHGATYSVGSNGKIYPEVVEGIATLTDSKGDVYMLYCGSGYWTQYYCLGQLKLTGDDPTDYDSWYKYPEPVLQKNNELCGTGHCCYTTSPDGTKNYIIYHAYLGTREEGEPRYMICEEYTLSDEGGITIGAGDGYPAPLSTGFTSAVNPMPFKDKISGFDGFAVFMRGDSNMDGRIDSDDLAQLARHVAGVESLSGGAGIAASDPDGSGSVDSEDLAAMARYISGVTPSIE